MSSGGDSIRMCGLSAFVRCGMQYFDTIKVPRVLKGSESWATWKRKRSYWKSARRRGASICTSSRLFGWHDHANPLNLQSKRPVTARWTARKGGYLQSYAIAFLPTITEMSGFWHVVRAAPPMVHVSKWH